ncbi:thioredoxin domain-containing protein, partial [Candidatus Amesbacteria bacterium]|nr:thioredoxin domain-containing protein [Candidatus Amesbacteria bacterium]
MKNWIIGAIILVLAGVGVWKMTAKPVDKLQSDLTSSKVTDKDWVRGKREAPVVIVEYGDFQCPTCGAYYPVLKQLEADYGENLAVVWREYPLTTVHANAWGAAAAAEAAGKQGKFWEMHDALFENQKEWTETGRFEGYAAKIGLDMNKWKADLTDKGIEDKIREDQNSGIDLNVTGTPTFFVNEVKIDLPGSYENFKKIIDGIPSSSNKIHAHFDMAVYSAGKKV